MTGVYTPPLRPYAHQQEALDLLVGRENFALFYAMRTGKTKITLDDFGRLELAGECQDLAVVAPGGVYRTWAGAAEEHLSADLKARLWVMTWESGAGTGFQRLLKAFLACRDRPRLFLMNVEALSSVKAAREAMLEFLKPRSSMLAIDESTIIKNPSSKRTKFINVNLAAAANFRRILSGLPAPKSPLDYYSQFEFLDWKILGFRSFFAFRGRYAVLVPQYFGGRSVQVVKGFRDLEDLAARIAPHSHRKLLRDCYDVPEKAYLFRDVELTPEQTRLYREMKDFATAQLDAESHVTATVVIAQLIRLHQILCGCTTDEMGVQHDIPENRTAALLELLEAHDGKAVIWCSYDANVRKVSAALEAEFGPGTVARFWGGNRLTRESEESRFTSESACRYMVATAAAGGRGRMWAVADLVVYYSNTNDLEHREQSEERTQKIGKDDKVTYVDLVARNTVDEKFIHALRAKIDLSAAVTGDGYRAWLV